MRLGLRLVCDGLLLRFRRRRRRGLVVERGELAALARLRASRGSVWLRPRRRSGRRGRQVAPHSVVLWDIAAASPARVFTGAVRASPRCAGARSSAFSADGTLLTVGLSDGSLELWDVASGRRADEIRDAHRGPVLALVFSWRSASSPGQSVYFSGGSDGAARLWSYRGAAGHGGDLGGRRCPPCTLLAGGCRGTAHQP